ncbi:MAG: sugar phosphate isomerase/epimerase family protein [Tepidisphaerales bacterium]
MRNAPLFVTRRQFVQAAGAATLAAAVPLRAAEPAPWTLRLSLSTVMFAETPIERVCEFAASLGFQAIDIWCPFDKCKHLDDVVQRLGPDGLKALLAKHKLAVSAFTVYNGGLARYGEFIGRFGGGVAVQGSQGGTYKPDQIVPAMKQFFEKLKPAIEQAGNANIQLAVENHGSALLDSVDSFKAFVDLNPDPKHVGIALAPYHMQAINAAVEETIAICGPQLLFFYAWQHAAGKDQLPGHGKTDFAPWLNALAKSGHPQYLNPFMHGNVPEKEMAEALVKASDYLKEKRR